MGSVVSMHSYVESVGTGLLELEIIWNCKFPCDTRKTMLLGKSPEVCTLIVIDAVWQVALGYWYNHVDGIGTMPLPRYPLDHGRQWLADSGLDAVGHCIRYARSRRGRQSLGWLCPWDPKRSRSRAQPNWFRCGESGRTSIYLHVEIMTLKHEPTTKTLHCTWPIMLSLVTRHFVIFGTFGWSCWSQTRGDDHIIISLKFVLKMVPWDRVMIMIGGAWGCLKPPPLWVSTVSK